MSVDPCCGFWSLSSLSSSLGGLILAGVSASPRPSSLHVTPCHLSGPRPPSTPQKNEARVHTADLSVTSTAFLGAQDATGLLWLWRGQQAPPHLLPSFLHHSVPLSGHQRGSSHQPRPRGRSEVGHTAPGLASLNAWGCLSLIPGEVGESSYSQGMFLNPLGCPPTPFPSALCKLSTLSLPGAEPGALLLRAEFAPPGGVFPSWASGDPCGSSFPRKSVSAQGWAQMEDTLRAHRTAEEDNSRPHVSCAFSPVHPCRGLPGRGKLPMFRQVDGAQSGH